MTQDASPEPFENIMSVVKFLEENINYRSCGFDSPPEPLSQFDYDLGQAANTLYRCAESLKAAKTTAPDLLQAARIFSTLSMAMP
jgi:hypothetical protein